MEIPVEETISSDKFSMKFNLNELVENGYDEAIAPETGKQWKELQPVERKHFLIIASGCIGFVMEALTTSEDIPLEVETQVTVRDKETI